MHQHLLSGKTYKHFVSHGSAQKAMTKVKLMHKHSISGKTYQQIFFSWLCTESNGKSKRKQKFDKKNYISFLMLKCTNIYIKPITTFRGRWGTYS
jgi:hypothetical protein